MNRAVHGQLLFNGPEDYMEFLEIVARVREKVPMRILAYCLMPNHWHFVLWPEEDWQLSKFLQRMTTSHAKRLRWRTGTVGRGAVYQGRYKAVPVDGDESFLWVVRYVERNPIRAGLVPHRAAWQFSSATSRGAWRLSTAAWPTDRPRNWAKWVDEDESQPQLDALRNRISRSLPVRDEPPPLADSAREMTDDEAATEKVGGAGTVPAAADMQPVGDGWAPMAQQAVSAAGVSENTSAGRPVNSSVAPRGDPGPAP
jgi:putative transposase